MHGPHLPRGSIQDKAHSPPHARYNVSRSKSGRVRKGGVGGGGGGVGRTWKPVQWRQLDG